MTISRKGITRNKNQAIYKYLPHSWISYKDKTDPRLGDVSYTAQVKSWNTVKFEDLYPQKIYESIRRKIERFSSKSGDISLFEGYEQFNKFSFVKAAENEGHPDILVEINPLLFYCPDCGVVNQISNPETVFSNLLCQKCHVKLKQLQMVYSCTCGYAEGVTIPDRRVSFKYIPNRIINGKKSTFSFLYMEGNNQKKREMLMTCPQCGERVLPKNATDNSNFRSHSVKSINLIKKSEGDLFSYGLAAQKVIISRWFNIITETQYNQILENQKSFFENISVIDESMKSEIERFVASSNGSITYEMAESFFKKGAQHGSGLDVDLKSTLMDLERRFDVDERIYSSLASTVVEFMTIKNARHVKLEEAIENMLRIGTISDSAEVIDANAMYGIKNVQLSHNIEVINSTYGFTRRDIEPSDNRLKIVPFVNSKEGKFNVFNSLLETEGILVEIDRDKIIDWLISNSYLSEIEGPLREEEHLKKWFISNINPENENPFSDGETSSTNVTCSRAVFTLLHSISHSLIKSAGIISGLDKNSLGELIFPNIPAIFIYANTVQGLPLGALSGMFEQKYLQFLQLAYDETVTCTFDPICSDNDNGACASCMFLSDVCCSYFNHDLTRHALHSDGNTIGFWG